MIIIVLYHFNLKCCISVNIFVLYKRQLVTATATAEAVTDRATAQ